MDLISTIEKYYELRGLKWPTTLEAMGWLNTELGEAYEALLMETTGWVRNNPDKDIGSFGEELGDIIMMAIVAGIMHGVNPIEELTNKMENKIRGRNDT